jgi:hypothetical protein
VLPERPLRFVRDEYALDDVLRDAKQQRCPRCRRSGTLIGHGLVRGYAEHGSERVVRGRRLLCSRRGRRSGCGRTLCVRISSVLAGFCARTWTLSRLLIAVVTGLCIKAAWSTRCACSLSLRSSYRLWKRFAAAQTQLRTVLCTASPPPDCEHAQPLAQLLVHLQHILGLDECVLARFQLVFQQPVFA